jgi:hypothetical protein
MPRGARQRAQRTEARESFMSRLIRICLLLVLCALAGAASRPGIPVRYMGGTVSGCAEKAAARLYLTGPEEFLFQCGAGEVKVEYKKVTRLEYGQTLHRRYGAAAAAAAVPVLWPVSAAVLLNRSRKHFVTIEYDGAEGGKQALVLRVEKDNIRALLEDLKARTGRPVEYQVEGPRKLQKKEGEKR